MSETGRAILEMREVSKRYPGTLAVDGVSFKARAGEVHALMGENGAGKSTLMKIIAGSFDDYTGQVLIRGEKRDLHSPAKSKAAGIEMIHQELSLALPLSIAENILAGRLPVKRGIFLDRKAMIGEAAQWLMRVGLEVDPMRAVETLSRHEAQLVEIAKALSNHPSILVMDEPTSALSRDEVMRLFEIICELKSRGLAVIYISHHIAEVFEVADRVTVMRDGRKVDTRQAGDLTANQLVEMMVGRSLNSAKIRRNSEPGIERLRVEHFSRYGFFHDVSFSVRAGEIVGIGGLAGSGRTELARSLCGIDPSDDGDVYLDDEGIYSTDLNAAMRQGLAYLTEDRKLEGLALDMTALENSTASLNVQTGRLTRRGKAMQLFRQLGEALNLYPCEPDRPANHFSGGNQQKILLAKWLAIAPQVCILDEPTSGVDVGAKQVIHEAIARLADEGKCVILISSDLPELVALSDRVLIMRKGRMIGEMARGEFSEDAILLAANAEGNGLR